MVGRAHGPLNTKLGYRYNTNKPVGDWDRERIGGELEDERANGDQRVDGASSLS